MKTRLFFAVGTLVLALPAVALAQIGAGPVTPVAPPTVATPTPQTPNVATGAPGGQGATGYDGGDFIIADNNPALWGGVRRRKPVPKFHVVKQGDTLWEICDTYYADPWAWPQLWAYNKSITNPHWIYPGDRVRLLGGAAEGEGSGGAAAETIRLSGTRSQVTGPMTFRQNAFIDPKEMEGAGTVSGAKEEKLLLANRDEIYVAPGDKMQPQVGKSFTVYRVRKPLENSEGEEVGYLVEVRGTAQVKRAPPGKVATAEITESEGPIERGNKVGPLRRRYKRVPVVKAGKNLKGQVIGALSDKVMHATDDVVFVDLGSSQGVQVGNRFLVVRTGDARKRLLQLKDDEDAKWPREVVAEISAIDVREKVTIGLITRALKEIRVGDNVVLRRGY